MGLMTSLRTRMTVVLWALLFLFLLSMSIGGLVGGANIIDQLAGRVDPNRVIARINGQDISPDYFNNLVNQQINQFKSNGQQVNDALYERARNIAWNNLIQEVIVSKEIEKLGLTATDEEILFHLKESPPQFLQDNPSFQTDGKFDSEKYLTALSTPQGDEWAPIENWMRSSYIPNFKLTQYLNQYVLVNDEDVLREFFKKNVKYTIDAIHVTNDKVSNEDSEPSEEELLNEYRSNKEDYKHDELRNISYISWKKVPSKQDSLDNKILSEKIIKNIRSGADFTDLAKEYSTDLGSQDNGGDLGWFGKGRMVKPFEDAAFGANKGEIVGPIESQFGSHIIKVRDKKTDNGKQEVLASHILLKTETSPTTLYDLKRNAKLYNYDAQDSGFVYAAEKLNLKIEKLINVNGSESILKNIGSFRSAVRFAFSNPIGSISDVLENDQYFAVFLIDSLIPADYTDFSDVKNQIKNKIRREKQKALSKDIIDEIVIAKTAENKQLSELMEKYKNYNTIKDESKTLSAGFTSIGRSNFVNGALLNSKRGDILGPLETNRGWALIQVKEISDIDSSDYEVQSLSLKNSLINRKQNQTLQSWIDNLKDNAEIIDNRNYFY